MAVTEGRPTDSTILGPVYTSEYRPLLGGSPGMQVIRDIVESVADINASVLLRGESGVGKDLVARAIHAASSRSQGPFIKVNCAAIPQGLLESELFGHEKGAFTGAHRRRPGQFEYANKGTIYLDEIGELPLSLQPKLLHVLQDLTFCRVGGTQRLSVDIRIIAATNRNLETAIARGDFRDDLYYRLNVVEILVPSLRERKEEIPGLAARFLDTFNRQYGRTKTLSQKVLDELMAHDWPGNIRELENIMRRLVVLENSTNGLSTPLGARPAPAVMPLDRESHQTLRDIARTGARDAERRALEKILQQTNWNRAAAARVLKVSYKTLLHKIAECGLKEAPPRQA